LIERLIDGLVDWLIASQVIAIGPTTEEELRVGGVKHVYVADRPNPAGVAEACRVAVHYSNQ